MWQCLRRYAGQGSSELWFMTNAEWEDAAVESLDVGDLLLVPRFYDRPSTGAVAVMKGRSIEDGVIKYID